ncbi:iron-sulfur cluster assembly accessory protein [Chroococcidiopsis sp. FACHB-1243]|uniref:HesB/IscA family protein n=1 Tax=Chroococcidiopsis sp. [FACHB-1243] TaxID=2692781 RepID=UPI00177BE5A1|nr:iron-sulfur cluster assembly accessory protein [Chroococcidiopsis sp. [FACHB-1243]]MBD2308295.1 iron-sulfur cluster assembly accessory protein [Chroococcidiopsis sp. [FACHB-1243]]
MIQISSSAAKEINRLRSKQSNPDILFRLRVQAGGCSGLYYDLEFDEATEQSDCILDCNGIIVAVDADSLNYIQNLRLDYSEDLMGGGFRFSNPLAIATCGCGNSFSVELGSREYGSGA